MNRPTAPQQASAPNSTSAAAPAAPPCGWSGAEACNAHTPAGNAAAERCESASRPVSRVLYGPGPCGPERGSHSSGTHIAVRLKQPTRMINPGKGPGLRPASSLFGLAPGGVYRAASVAGRAVGSYPTLSPLPRRLIVSQAGNQVAGRFAFCGTFPGVAPAGRYPAPFIRGARTFLALLSFDVAERGCPADWRALLRPPGGRWPEL